jgi:hypothetical protein
MLNKIIMRIRESLLKRLGSRENCFKKLVLEILDPIVFNLIDPIVLAGKVVYRNQVGGN